MESRKAIRSQSSLRAAPCRSNPRFGKVCVIGLGHVGLPTAALMASAGFRVVGVDINPSLIDALNAGEPAVKEEDLSDLIRNVVGQGALTAHAEPQPADIFVVAVPTPCDTSRHADLASVRQAVASLAPYLRRGNVVLLESTCPVGTTEALSRWLGELRPDLVFPTTADHPIDVHLAYCPERVLPGRTVTEVLGNDRIVGGLTPACAAEARIIYETFVHGECTVTDARTAEMTKLAENAYRDVNIAFANELSVLCDKVGVDVWELIELANRHPRVEILRPGPGVGGHCVAVDPWFLVQAAPEEANLIRTARQVNDSKPSHILRRVLAAAESYENPVVACLGLTFKPDIGDLRESPALAITTSLAAARVGQVIAVEPNIRQLPESLVALDVQLATIDQALESADVIVLLVDHQEFRTLACPGGGRAVIDTRGMWRQHGQTLRGEDRLRLRRAG